LILSILNGQQRYLVPLIILLMYATTGPPSMYFFNREAFVRVRDEDSTTLESTKDARTGRCVFQTNIEVVFERRR
jgi:hypothetical protein